MSCLILGGHNIIVGILFAFGFRLILRVGPRIVKRNLAQRDPVEALQGFGTRFCILSRILAAHRLIAHISPNAISAQHCTQNRCHIEPPRNLKPNLI